MLKLINVCKTLEVYHGITWHDSQQYKLKVKTAFELVSNILNLNANCKFQKQKVFFFNFMYLLRYRGKRIIIVRALHKLRGKLGQTFLLKKSNFWWHKVRARDRRNQVSFSIFTTSFLAAFFLFYVYIVQWELKIFSAIIQIQKR